MPQDARAVLQRQIAEHAIVRGHIQLSGGQEADYYIDLRQITLSGYAALLVGAVMLDLTADMAFDAVGGLTMGADPVAIAMLHEAAQRGHLLDACVVRKEAKAHGLQKNIEGPSVAGRRVLVVEDTSTTGKSALTAVKALRAGGAEVVGVAVLVDRGTGAQEAIEAAGLSYRAAFTAAEFGLA